MYMGTDLVLQQQVIVVVTLNCTTEFLLQLQIKLETSIWRSTILNDKHTQFYLYCTDITCDGWHFSYLWTVSMFSGTAWHVDIEPQINIGNCPRHSFLCYPSIHMTHMHNSNSQATPHQLGKTTLRSPGTVCHCSLPDYPSTCSQGCRTRVCTQLHQRKKLLVSVKS